MNSLWKRSLIVGLLLIVALVLTAQLVAADPYDESIAVSAAAAGMTDDGLAYDTNDIIVRETEEYTGLAANSIDTAWYTLFDGDYYGLGPKHAINAFSVSAPSVPGTGCALACVDAIYMSFVQDAIPVPGISPKVQGEDVVAFEPDLISDVDGDFSMFFDGSDVGLTTTAEKIDGLDVWLGLFPTEVEFPYDCNAGALFISTQGAYRVPAANGGSLVGEGNDVLIFCATNLGWDTAGFWFRGFDAADQDWPTVARNAISGVDIAYFIPFVPGEQEEDEAALLFFTFTVKKSFDVPNAVGGPSELFGYPGCNDDVFGPFEDLNGDWPALNGTVAGYDLLTQPDGPGCG